MGKSNTASAAVNMDKITGGRKLKDLFRGDKVLHDNFLFKLHHQANFAIILFGVAFIFGMNYLNGNAIECKGKDVGDFEKQYCWLHGAGHINPNLHPTQDIKCKADQNEMTSEFKKDERHSHYYLWVPFVLALCLAVIKAPRVLWKEVCERGMIAGAVGGEDGQPAEKIAERFRKLRRKAIRFHWAFFFCEVLNIVSVIACFTILDTLFGGNFMDYGSKYSAYTSSENKADDVNPLCNLFPSVVSCTLLIGGATGNPDQTSILCLLSNNLFNQYYFLIVWYWWVALLSVSALGLVYRLAGIISPDVSKWVFVCKMEPHGQDRTAGRLEKLTSADYFLLGRICQNLKKGSLIQEVLQEVNKQVNKTELVEDDMEVLVKDVDGNSEESKLPKIIYTE